VFDDRRGFQADRKGIGTVMPCHREERRSGGNVGGRRKPEIADAICGCVCEPHDCLGGGGNGGVVHAVLG
jgi:hypothetical protein